jgi:hypothetical protein
MAEVAVNGGGISGDTNANGYGDGGEERWSLGYGLGLAKAKEDESGLAVSLNFIWTYYHCLLTS